MLLIGSRPWRILFTHTLKFLDLEFLILLLVLSPAKRRCFLVGFGCVGRKLHANAEDSEELVDPPKVEEKIGAVPNGLSTDSDVVKRFVNFLFTLSVPQLMHMALSRVKLKN